MFYLQNKNRHPSGPLPEKTSKWVDTQQPINIPHTLKAQHLPHLLLHISLLLMLCRHLPAAFLWILRDHLCCPGVPLLPLHSAAASFISGHPLHLHWSMTPELNSQCIMKIRFQDWKSFLWLKQRLFTCSDVSWAGDELVKLPLWQESEGGANFTKAQSPRFWYLLSLVGRLGASQWNLAPLTLSWSLPSPP